MPEINGIREEGEALVIPIAFFPLRQVAPPVAEQVGESDAADEYGYDGYADYDADGECDEEDEFENDDTAYWEPYPVPLPAAVRRYGQAEQALLADYNLAQERELRANMHKRPWWTMSVDELLAEVDGHVKKLKRAAKAGDRAGVDEYAADVGNCAAFVRDVFLRLTPEEQAHE